MCSKTVNMMDLRLLFESGLIYLSLAKAQKYISYTMLEASECIWLFFMAIIQHPAAKLCCTPPTFQRKTDDKRFMEALNKPNNWDLGFKKCFYTQ